MSRSATIKRTTAETSIELSLEIDGDGTGEISTAVPFMDHMLILLKKHGFFNLSISASGDVEIDDHHTVEDVGICLGEAFKQALGDKQGLRRYGRCTMPMHEALAEVVLDFSGRPHLVYNVAIPTAKVGNFDTELVEEFFTAFCNHAGVNLHVNLAYGSNSHHIIEALFKGFGRALDEATAVDARVAGVMSTKGKLE